MILGRLAGCHFVKVFFRLYPTIVTPLDDVFLFLNLQFIEDAG